MNKVDIDCFTELQESEYGFVGVNKTNLVLEEILKGKRDSGNVVLYYGERNSKSICYRILKVDYGQYEDVPVEEEIIRIRNEAVYNAFACWDALGHNKKHCKNPYKSKTFTKAYLSIVDNKETVYVLIRVE